MPLYLYACRTCELELEEMHPLGKAPDRSIRCPLCGGYFERDIAIFSVGGQTKPVATVNASTNSAEGAAYETSPFAHGIDCLCCRPRR